MTDEPGNYLLVTYCIRYSHAMPVMLACPLDSSVLMLSYRILVNRFCKQHASKSSMYILNYVTMRNSAELLPASRVELPSLVCSETLQIWDSIVSGECNCIRKKLNFNQKS